MNCSPGIHFIVPSHWELKGLYSRISLNNGPHSCSTTQGEKWPLSCRSQGLQNHKSLFVHPSQSLPVTWNRTGIGAQLATCQREYKTKVKFFTQMSLVGPRITVESKTPESWSKLLSFDLSKVTKQLPLC